MANTTSTGLVVDPTTFITQRRRSTRQPLEGAATLIAEEGPFMRPGMDVWVFDLSLSGIGFRSSKPAPLGSIHRIHLDTRTVHLSTRIRVARCDRRDTGFDIGAEFIED